ncbi:MAG: APC family permease [Vitreoscilla sp.]|nr:APC family permease [Vitreoscilla sp.]
MNSPTTPIQTTPLTATPALGLAALFSVAIGVIVGQSTIVSLLQAVGISGWGFLGAMAIGYGLMLCNSASFAELALLMPRAGGLSGYCEAALGHFPAIFAVFAGYVVPALFGPAAEMLVVGGVMDQLLPGTLPTLAWAGLLMGVLVVLNLLGTDVFAKLQTGLTFTMLAALGITGLWALGHAPEATTAASVASSGWAGMAADTTVLGVVALVMYSLIGTEFVTPLTADAAQPERNVPRAMFLGLTVVTLVNVVFCLGASAHLGRAKLAESPLPHLDYALAVFGPGVRLVFATIAVVATASLLNTVLGAVPRMLQAMAEAGQVFPIFKHVNRHGVPWVATLFVAGLPLVGLLWSGGDVNRIVPLLVAAASAWLVAYMVAHAAVVALRLHAPGAPRPYRVPLYPLPQIVAVLGLGYVIAHAAPAPEMEGPIFAALGWVLGLVALIGALWVRLVMKRALFKADGLPR